MPEKVEKTNLITPRGVKVLVDEATHLWEVERPKVVEEVHQAAAQGDRSENAEYIYGKKRLREIDRRLHFLQKRLDLAKIMDPKLQSGDKIAFGATVTIENDDGEERSYQIVGEDEAEPSIGRISWKSPIGQALLTKRVGDAVEVQTPKGVIEIIVVSFRFE